MIQSTYTSVTNAEITPCNKKGCIINSEPIPLLRNNYLGEYRTELEKAKVRKNLGIADEQSLIWGSIKGHIEDQTDLMDLIGVYTYTEPDKDLTIVTIATIKEALDYALKFVSTYEVNTEATELLQQQMSQTILDLNNLKTNVNAKTEELDSAIEQINNSISSINTALLNLNIDDKIETWFESKESTTFKLENGVISVIISQKENNALVDSDGLYVKDLSGDFENLKNSFDSLEVTYDTILPDVTTSPLLGGITVGELKGKNYSEILDTLLFPTVVRDLIYPSLYYDKTDYVVKVGTFITSDTLTFVQNDAGEELTREESWMFNDSPIESGAFNNVGIFTRNGTVTYAEGEPLEDNKGNVVPDLKVSAGEITTSYTVIATMPWYTGNNESVSEMSLIPFNLDSGEQLFSITGKGIIKLPGVNSRINLFQADGGLGYLNIDMSGWTESTEQIDNYTYKVWTKTDSYLAMIPHKINFILSE